MRRRRLAPPSPTLFPFLDLLAALLGCLVMVVLATTALSVGAGKTVTVEAETPGALANPKRPTYVEWDGSALVLQPSRIKVPWARASGGGGRNDSAFGELLAEVRSSKEDRYLIVLLRPSGFGNALPVIELIASAGVDVGYEPIDQDWTVRVKEDHR